MTVMMLCQNLRKRILFLKFNWDANKHRFNHVITQVFSRTYSMILNVYSASNTHTYTHMHICIYVIFFKWKTEILTKIIGKRRLENYFS